MKKKTGNSRPRYNGNKKNSQKSEMAGITLFSVSLLLILGITTGNRLLGQGGGYIRVLFSEALFGYPAVIIPLLMAIFAVILLFHRPFKGFFLFSFYSLAGMLLVSLGFGILRYIKPEWAELSRAMSGGIGETAGAAIFGYVGTAGSIIVWITLTLVFIIRACRVNIHAVTELITRGAFWAAGCAGFILSLTKKIWIWGFPYLKKGVRILILAIRYKPEKKVEGRRKKESPPADRKPVTTAETAGEPQKEAWEVLAGGEGNTDDAEPIHSVPDDSAPGGGTSAGKGLIIAESKPREEEVKLPERSGPYRFPPLDLLDKPLSDAPVATEEECRMNAEIIETTLADFGVEAKVVEVMPGPVITLYEVSPAPGVKISKIAGLSDDLALAMKAKGIRIIAPIPGKSVVGIEIPNVTPSTVHFREIVGSQTYNDSRSKLTLAFGKTIGGESFCADLLKMPHLLIAGSTGSGKSVGINNIITSILYKAHPMEVQFLLIDPKKLELSLYRALVKHHLLRIEGIDEDVITKASNATLALRSVEREMERRYELLAGVSVRNISDYNKKVPDLPPDEEGEKKKSLPYIVVIIDELADLMMVGAREVEEPIARLAQMSRAVGIHLVIATQRPSVDVITGVIKANFSARIAFQVASKVDSRTILDMNGAEKLLGKGDMLFLPTGEPKPIRLQCAYISTEEVERVVSHVASQPIFIRESLELKIDKSLSASDGMGIDGADDLLPEARKLVIRHQQGSISLLQRRLKVGYSRAARLIDLLEEEGVVGPFDGSKARQVLVDESYLESLEG